MLNVVIKFLGYSLPLSNLYWGQAIMQKKMRCSGLISGRTPRVERLWRWQRGISHRGREKEAPIALIWEWKGWSMEPISPPWCSEKHHTKRPRIWTSKSTQTIRGAFPTPPLKCLRQRLSTNLETSFQRRGRATRPWDSWGPGWLDISISWE